MLCGWYTREVFACALKVCPSDRCSMIRVETRQIVVAQNFSVYVAGSIFTEWWEYWNPYFGGNRDLDFPIASSPSY